MLYGYTAANKTLNKSISKFKVNILSNKEITDPFMKVGVQ